MANNDGEIAVGKRDGGEEENMAAWLLGIQTLKIQPYQLPTLGKVCFFSLKIDDLPFSSLVAKVRKKSPFWVVGPHDVKVRIKALGICGSDVHHFKVIPKN